MTVYPNKYRDERESKSEPSTTIDKLLQIVLKYQTLLNDQKRSTKKRTNLMIIIKRIGMTKNRKNLLLADLIIKITKQSLKNLIIIQRQL